jgi:GAF domain-containing protein
LKLHGPAHRSDGRRQITCLRTRDPQLQIHRRSVRQFSPERLEHLESLAGAAAAALGGAQDEAGGGMRRIDVQNFPRLFLGEVWILL